MARILTPTEAATTTDSPDVLVARDPFGDFVFLPLSARGEDCVWSHPLSDDSSDALALDQYDALAFFDHLFDNGYSVG